MNELICAGGKLACDIIGVPLRNPNRNTKPGWEIRLEGYIWKLRHLAKVIRKEKCPLICCDEKTKIKLQTSLTMQCEEKSKDIGEERKT